MTFNHRALPEFNLDCVTSDDGRYYTTPEGHRYDSVTTWLGQRAGKQESLEKWRERIGHHEAEYITETAATRGNVVHDYAEQYLANNTLPIVNPVDKKLCNQLRPMCDKYIEQVYGLEYALYSDTLKLAGRTDCIAKVNGKLAVIDFKTSTKYKRKNWIHDYFIQTAVYARMIEERYGTLPSLIGIFIAVKNGIHGQVYFEDTNKWKNHEYILNRINDLAD